MSNSNFKTAGGVSIQFYNRNESLRRSLEIVNNTAAPLRAPDILKYYLIRTQSRFFFFSILFRFIDTLQ